MLEARERDWMGEQKYFACILTIAKKKAVVLDFPVLLLPSSCVHKKEGQDIIVSGWKR